MPRPHATITHIGIAMLLAGAAWPCAAREPADIVTPASALGAEWVAIGTERLERMRGGFVLPSGLAISFGIERVVYVNGELVATARLSIPDITKMTPVQAQGLAEMRQGMLVQVGDGNAFVPSGAINGVVIQNSLDNQDIRTLTTLDVGVGTLGMFKALNSQAALQDALQSAVGTP